MTDRVSHLIYESLTDDERRSLLRLRYVERIVDAGEEVVVLFDKPIRTDDLNPTRDLADMITQKHAALGYFELFDGLPMKHDVLEMTWAMEPTRKDGERVSAFIKRLRTYMVIERAVRELHEREERCK